MDGGILVKMGLLFLWSYGLMRDAAAEPTVFAWIATPEADRKEGGQVHIKCVATNLESDHIVELGIGNPTQTLRWGSDTVTGNRRFNFETTQPVNGVTIQDFTINDLQRDDTEEYTCNVNDRIRGGGQRIVATARVSLSVLYFPSESFPICSPDGPIRVDTGTELNMQCSSEGGFPKISMELVSPVPTRCNTFTWTASTINDTVSRSLDLIVDVADNDLVFDCVISSMHFSGMTRSCTIGPIRIVEPTDPTLIKPPTQRELGGTTPSSVSSELYTTSHLPSAPTSTGQPTLLVPLATLIGTVILLGVSVTINIFVIQRSMKQARLIKSLTKGDTRLSNAEPYMELQPTNDKNRAYMGLAVTHSSNTHQAYFQAVDTEGECRQRNCNDGAEKSTNPDGKYEKVGMSKNNVHSK